MAQSTGKRVFLEKMQAEKDLIREQGLIASHLRAESEAERFIGEFDAREKRYEARIRSARGFDEASLPEGAEGYLAEWHAASEAYLAERQRVEEENARIRATNDDLPRKAHGKLLALPAAPKRWQARPENPWERAVYDTLVMAQASPGRAQTIKLRGRGHIRIDSTAVSSDLVSYAVYLSPDGNAEGDIRLSDGLVTAKDFRNSEKLLAAFDPNRIMMRVRVAAKEMELQQERHRDMLPQMREVRERGVDTARRDSLRERLAALTAMARIGEVKFAAETASAGPNRFALADDKGRDLRADATAAPITGEFRFNLGGRGYTSEWGAPAGRQRVEGTATYADRAFFEATDTSSGDPVVVEALGEGEDGEATWRATSVHTVPDAGEAADVREMRTPAPEPVASVQSFETIKGNTLPDRQRAAVIWFRQNLVVPGVKVKNRETGMEIGFDVAEAKESSQRTGDDTLAVLPALTAILEEGRYLGFEPDRKGRRNVRGVHRLQAFVSLDGKLLSVIAMVRELNDGTFHYRLAKDRIAGVREIHPPVGASEKRADQALEGDASGISLDLVPEESKTRTARVEAVPPITDDDLAAIARDLEAWVRRAGLKQKVPVEVVRRLASGAQGFYQRGTDGEGRITISADAPAGSLGVLRHEVIHALRAMKQFTEPEWKALVRAARRNQDIRAHIERDYADLSQERRDEEMVAELFRVWGEDRANTDAPARLMERIRSFLEALANALAGRGFHAAATMFRAIEQGEMINKRRAGDWSWSRGLQLPKDAQTLSHRHGRRVLQHRDVFNTNVAGDAGANTEHEMRAASRRPITMPPAIIGGDLASMTSLPAYPAAKAGDIPAAVSVARVAVNDRLVEQARTLIGARRPVIVPVVSEEASGRNKIPLAAARLLGERLTLRVTPEIIQSNTPKRSGMTGLDRIFASPVFDGPVRFGQDYLLLDDTLTQGGTFAALAGHIEAGGGRVIAAVALTGKAYSAKIALTQETLDALREKHGDIETGFRTVAGYGFDALTESEARYLTNFKPADAIRDRVAAEGRKGVASDDRSDAESDPGAIIEREMRWFTANPANTAAETDRKERRLLSNLLTNSMGAGRFNLLALVPTRPLFTELGKNLSSARTFLALKDAMDAERNKWHNEAGELTNRWRGLLAHDTASNRAMMDLMVKLSALGK